MVEATKSPEELLSLAKEAGYELSHEQLEAISGGSWCFAVSSPPVCVEVCTQDFVCPNACIVVH